jgi:hypothetical protein
MSLQLRNILLLSILALLSFQSKAQEIETREDALRYISSKCTFFTIDGDRSYVIDRIKMEDENLLFIIRSRKYEKRYTYGSTQNFILDFSDSLKLTEKESLYGKKHKYLCIQYKQYYFNGGTGIKNKEKRESMESFYKALKKLEQTRKINETQEYKLAELKKGKLTYTKTEISEEQRKYIVQANAANENKDYENALVLFQNALNINPYSYPAAYFNMALIHANLFNYYQAVYAMKQYLIVAPDAEDARQAQDKIYEWELNTKY